MRAGVVAVGFGLVLALTLASRPSAQLPFATPKSSGQTVTPAYEGWYKNADGRVTQNWPGTLLEFWEQTRGPDPAQYELL